MYLPLAEDRPGEPDVGCDAQLVRIGGQPRFFPAVDAHGYRVKPRRQLVRVSSKPHGSCTSRLSTSWPRTTLQGGRAPGKSHLEASFPLRCFQRLSLPHIATRRCHWRDNRYTRGASTPVLSY